MLQTIKHLNIYIAPQQSSKINTYDQILSQFPYNSVQIVSSMNRDQLQYQFNNIAFSDINQQFDYQQYRTHQISFLGCSKDQIDKYLLHPYLKKLFEKYCTKQLEQQEQTHLLIVTDQNIGLEMTQNMIKQFSEIVFLFRKAIEEIKYEDYDLQRWQIQSQAFSFEIQITQPAEFTVQGLLIHEKKKIHFEFQLYKNKFLRQYHYTDNPYAAKQHVCHNRLDDQTIIFTDQQSYQGQFDRRDEKLFGFGLLYKGNNMMAEGFFQGKQLPKYGSLYTTNQESNMVKIEDYRFNSDKITEYQKEDYEFVGYTIPYKQEGIIDRDDSNGIIYYSDGNMYIGKIQKWSFFPEHNRRNGEGMILDSNDSIIQYGLYYNDVIQKNFAFPPNKKQILILISNEEQNINYKNDNRINFIENAIQVIDQVGFNNINLTYQIEYTHIKLSQIQKKLEDYRKFQISDEKEIIHYLIFLQGCTDVQSYLIDIDKSKIFQKKIVVAVNLVGKPIQGQILFSKLQKSLDLIYLEETTKDHWKICSNLIDATFEINRRQVHQTIDFMTNKGLYKMFLKNWKLQYFQLQKNNSRSV